MSSRRLADTGIFCLNPMRIAICGKVRVACFDKTGTITKEGLEFRGIKATKAAEEILVGRGEEGRGGGVLYGKGVKERKNKQGEEQDRVRG